ncbi:hypothetical protein PFISCL1PPCAC_22166, partial [Pristionchus fissidentatus]
QLCLKTQRSAQQSRNALRLTTIENALVGSLSLQSRTNNKHILIATNGADRIMRRCWRPTKYGTRWRAFGSSQE